MTKEQLQNLCDRGLSQRAIAENLKVSQSTVKYWMKRHNLKTKHKSRVTAWDGFGVTEELFIKLVKENQTVADVLRALGIAVAQGATYKEFWRRVKRLNLSTDHFDRSYKNKANPTRRYQTEDLLVIGSTYDTGSLKKRLLREGLLRNQCYECSSKPEWRGKPLTLHMDHINGNRSDNRLENLRILCPNCHTQTPTYCGAQRKRLVSCLDCAKEVSRKSTRCKSCETILRNAKQKTKIEWPDVPSLIQSVGETSYEALGRKLGVSGAAVRKRIANHGPSH